MEYEISHEVKEALMYLAKKKQKAQNLCMARQSLPSSETESEELERRFIKVGSFYELDHSKLPPKSPEQLYSIRIVMVNDESSHSVSLRFPSVHSLRSHFGEEIPHNKSQGRRLPGLDEKYIMGSDTAARVLRRRIPHREMAERGQFWSFWSPPSQPYYSGGNGCQDLVSKRGSCWAKLRFGGMVQWGRRRQVRFLNRHEEYALGRSSNTTDDDEEKNTEDGDKDGDGDDEEEEEEEDEEEEAVREDEEESVEVVMTRRSSKRKKPIKTSNNNENNPGRSSKRVKRKKQNPAENARSGNKKTVFKNSIDRWSVARYKLAEKNMLKIMKAKEAFFGKPILRPALRAEARKLIGDTGLLDHLLKHMAGKLAPGGAERFCRRHNSQGAMEYWLESADLMNIRKEAGVQDPYWTPPHGWKPGDNPFQDPVSAKEIESLKKEIAKIQKNSQRENMMIKEEITKMKRHVEELSFNNPENNMAMAIHANSDLTSVQSDNESSPVLKKIIQKELMGFKSKMEEQLMEFSGRLNAMKERMGMEEPSLYSSLESQKPLALALPECDETRKVQRRKTEDKATRIERLKSGFRICKPQGSFMWPNNTLTTLSDPLHVPTPPSASSTSAPPGILSLVVPSSPVKPLAEKRPIKSTTLSSVSVHAQPQALNILLNLNEAPDEQNTDDTIRH